MALAFSFTFCSSFMKPARAGRRRGDGVGGRAVEQTPSRRWRKDAGMNTGLLLEEPVLGVPISVISAPRLTGSFQRLSFTKISRTIRNVFSATRLVRLVDDGRVVSIRGSAEALRRVQVNAGLGRHAVAAQTGASPVRRLLGHEARADARHLLRSSLPHVVEDTL